MLQAAFLPVMYNCVITMLDEYWLAAASIINETCMMMRHLLMPNQERIIPMYPTIEHSKDIPVVQGVRKVYVQLLM